MNDADVFALSPTSAWGIGVKEFSGDFSGLREVVPLIESFLGHPIDHFASKLQGGWNGHDACLWCGKYAPKPLEHPNFYNEITQHWRYAYTCDDGCYNRWYRYYSIVLEWFEQMQAEDEDLPSNAICNYPEARLFPEAFIGWENCD